MTLRRLKEPALYIGYGFVSDFSIAQFYLCLSTKNICWALFWNLVLMLLSKKLWQTKSLPLWIAWIAGQSAGIVLALML
jgi:hypothetical protein